MLVLYVQAAIAGLQNRENAIQATVSSSQMTWIQHRTVPRFEFWSCETICEWTVDLYNLRSDYPGSRI